MENTHALFLGQLVLIEAIPHVGVNEVRTLDSLAVVRDEPAAAVFLHVLLHDGLVLLVELVGLRAVVEVHAEMRRDHAKRGADLRAVADEHDLDVLQLLSGGDIFKNGAHIADFLRGVIVVAHGVDHGNTAAHCQIHDGLMLDHASHDDIDHAGDDLAGVANRLVAAELDHAGPEILRVTAKLLHSRLK